jgi:hypothetical protein
MRRSSSPRTAAPVPEDSPDGRRYLAGVASKKVILPKSITDLGEELNEALNKVLARGSHRFGPEEAQMVRDIGAWLVANAAYPGPAPKHMVTQLKRAHTALLRRDADPRHDIYTLAADLVANVAPRVQALDAGDARAKAIARHLILRLTVECDLRFQVADDDTFMWKKSKLKGVGFDHVVRLLRSFSVRMPRLAGQRSAYGIAAELAFNTGAFGKFPTVDALRNAMQQKPKSA